MNKQYGDSSSRTDLDDTYSLLSNSPIARTPVGELERSEYDEKATDSEDISAVERRVEEEEGRKKKRVAFREPAKSESVGQEGLDCESFTSDTDEFSALERRLEEEEENKRKWMGEACLDFLGDNTSSEDFSAFERRIEEEERREQEKIEMIKAEEEAKMEEKKAAESQEKAKEMRKGEELKKVEGNIKENTLANAEKYIEKIFKENLKPTFLSSPDKITIQDDFLDERPPPLAFQGEVCDQKSNLSEFLETLPGQGERVLRIIEKLTHCMVYLVSLNKEAMSRERDRGRNCSSEDEFSVMRNGATSSASPLDHHTNSVLPCLVSPHLVSYSEEGNGMETLHEQIEACLHNATSLERLLTSPTETRGTRTTSPGLRKSLPDMREREGEVPLTEEESGSDAGGPARAKLQEVMHIKHELEDCVKLSISLEDLIVNFVEKKEEGKPFSQRQRVSVSMPDMISKFDVAKQPPEKKWGSEQLAHVDASRDYRCLVRSPQNQALNMSPTSSMSDGENYRRHVNKLDYPKSLVPFSPLGLEASSKLVRFRGHSTPSTSPSLAGSQTTLSSPLNTRPADDSWEIGELPACNLTPSVTMETAVSPIEELARPVKDRATSPIVLENPAVSCQTSKRYKTVQTQSISTASQTQDSRSPRSPYSDDINPGSTVRTLSPEKTETSDDVTTETADNTRESEVIRDTKDSTETTSSSFTIPKKGCVKHKKRAPFPGRHPNARRNTCKARRNTCNARHYPPCGMRNNTSKPPAVRQMTYPVNKRVLRGRKPTQYNTVTYHVNKTPPSRSEIPLNTCSSPGDDTTLNFSPDYCHRVDTMIKRHRHHDDSNRKEQPEVSSILLVPNSSGQIKDEEIWEKIDDSPHCCNHYGDNYSHETDTDQSEKRMGEVLRRNSRERKMMLKLLEEMGLTEKRCEKLVHVIKGDNVIGPRDKLTKRSANRRNINKLM